MTKFRIALFHLPIVLVFICCLPCRAQVPTGTPPFGSFGGGPDIIDNANLNAMVDIPIRHKAGRGISFTYDLVYNTSVWYPVTSSGTQTWQPVTNFGWSAQTQAALGYISYLAISETCPDPPNPPVPATLYTEWFYHDPFGATHVIPVQVMSSSSQYCPLPYTATGTATDGSGYTGTVTASPSATLTSRAGKVLNVPLLTISGSGTATDSNGNQISVSSGGVFTDTLGTTALTVAGSGTPSSPVILTYAAPSGANASYTVKYTDYNIQTGFGCSGISEYSASSIPLVSEIDLPDVSSNPSDKYIFTYEATAGHSGDVTGRLSSVTLPTGGTISYVYTGSHDGIECSDGSGAGLTRTTPDGEWTYTRTLGTAPASTTTVKDPQGNQTVIDFQGIYETERLVYQGLTSGTLLKTRFICYNGATPNCNTTSVGLPITQRSVYVLWPGTGGLESRGNTSYNSHGLATEKDDYAYGTGAPGSIARKTLITYASLGNEIENRPAEVTVEDGSGNIKSQTTYTYDQGTITSTSGTPQHVSVSGSRGNATTIAYLVQGSTTLSKTFTYFDTGNVVKATDVNAAQTTYTYGDCGNSFVTSVSEPLSLSRSMAWNCTGGVETSVTDENTKTATTTLNDHYFWRPNAVTDQESNVTNMTYDGATSAEASLIFNSSASTSDVLGNLDGLGRIHVSQVREAPGSSTFDSVETDYDSLGRPSKKSLPYSGSAGQTDSSAPGTTTTYDALGRKTEVTDSGGRTVIFSFTQNDAYRTLGPAPSGENTKQKQFEFDALHRLTSVCEITSATGSGSCAQTSAATGYWTKYTYDVTNHLTGVTQNAQSSSTQTRSYSYDDLGRLTSETNPESGTTSYTYDTDTTCGTSKGDVVKKVDAVGNVICFAYDALHRMTSTFVSSGSYASSTPKKYFVYDAATVSGVAMAIAKARMAEAYTCTSPCTSKITDIGFSYSARGETSDVYESTPHSGGYNHTNETYWANGALNQISGLSVLPTITYNVDGEGRIYSAAASSGQNPLSSTTYSVASLPTEVNLGSLDSDAFTYDPNTDRMTQYQFNVNGQSVVGQLTWNSIGTLESLDITDPFYAGGNQTCTYSHDDVSRIASASCGSVWSQTFSYDAFGNISKSGSSSFQPTYSYLTNQMTQIGSSTPSYDANGNVTNDFLHMYAWDANGRPVTIDGVGVTYDALGRLVEQNQSGTYSEIVYAPTGAKLAIMSGSSLQKAFVPLTGGAVAVYNSSGLAYYRHSDWIGSSRFASTPTTRAMYFDGAYAPFGEPYAQTGATDLSFTGMNQDTVPNLYDFPAREYGVQGRWPSPDPAGLAAVHLRDPQTLNRYAYVRNSPLSKIDPLGLDECDECGEDDGGSNENGDGEGGPGDNVVDAGPQDPGNPPDIHETEPPSIDLCASTGICDAETDPPLPSSCGDVADCFVVGIVGPANPVEEGILPIDESQQQLQQMMNVQHAVETLGLYIEIPAAIATTGGALTYFSGAALAGSCTVDPNGCALAYVIVYSVVVIVDFLLLYTGYEFWQNVPWPPDFY